MAASGSLPPLRARAGDASAASVDSGASEGGLRRRPVPVHHDFRVVEPEEDDVDQDEQQVVFEDEQQSRLHDYYAVFSDYVFWILMAYCVATVALYALETAGVISPHYERWNPQRWWHSNSEGVQQELYANASTALQFESLKKWVESGDGGWVSPKLAVLDHMDRGRYDRKLQVVDSVVEDELLIKLPLSRVLTALQCQRDTVEPIIRQLVDAQRSASGEVEIAPWTWIALYMFTHSQKRIEGDGSRFDSLLNDEYIDVALSYIPLFWDDDNLKLLNGTDFLNVQMLEAHAAIESEYHRLVSLLPSIKNSISVIEFKKWAMVVMSRAETINLPDPSNASHIMPQLAVMPLIDLVDHHLPMPDSPLTPKDDLQRYQETRSGTNVSYSQEFASIVFRAREPLMAEAPVTVGYGVRSSADYLLYHGFTMPPLWSDLTLCTLHTMIELPLPADMPSWKSNFLKHQYRFVVPACPHDRFTPHLIVGAARFIVSSDKEFVDFEQRVSKDPTLFGGSHVLVDPGFLHHSAKEAMVSICDSKTSPPLCRFPLSAKNEVAAWDLILKQTLTRVASHVLDVVEDDRLLAEDDSKKTLSANQKHATIVRREEKLALRRWCALVVKMIEYLRTEASPADYELVHLPDDQRLSVDEPESRPRYWAKLSEPIADSEVPPQCRRR